LDERVTDPRYYLPAVSFALRSFDMGRDTVMRSGKDVANHSAMHIRQTEIAAIVTVGEFLVIKTK